MTDDAGQHRSAEIDSAQPRNTSFVVALTTLSVLSVAGVVYSTAAAEGGVSSLVGFLVALVVFVAILITKRHSDGVDALSPMWAWVLGALALGYGLGSTLAKGPKFDVVFLVGFLIGGLLVGLSRLIVSRSQ